MSWTLKLYKANALLSVTQYVDLNTVINSAKTIMCSLAPPAHWSASGHCLNLIWTTGKYRVELEAPPDNAVAYLASESGMNWTNSISEIITEQHERYLNKILLHVKCDRDIHIMFHSYPIMCHLENVTMFRVSNGVCTTQDLPTAIKNLNDNQKKQLLCEMESFTVLCKDKNNPVPGSTKLAEDIESDSEY